MKLYFFFNYLQFINIKHLRPNQYETLLLSYKFCMRVLYKYYLIKSHTELLKNPHKRCSRKASLCGFFYAYEVSR